MQRPKKQKPDGKRETVKETFITLLKTEPITLSAAARRAGVGNRSTVWRWRQSDADFDRAVAEAQKHQDSLRIQAIEDSLFDRILMGKASAAETIFWLCNRGGGRWRHVAAVKHSFEPPEPGTVTFEQVLLAAANGGLGRDDDGGSATSIVDVKPVGGQPGERYFGGEKKTLTRSESCLNRAAVLSS